MPSPTAPPSTSHLLTIENTTIDALEATPDVSITEHFRFEGLPFEVAAIDAPSDVADVLSEYAAVEQIESAAFAVFPQVAGPTPIDDPAEREPIALADSAATIADVRSLHNLPDADGTPEDTGAAGEGVSAVIMDSGVDTTHPVFDGVSVRHVDATSDPVREYYDPGQPGTVDRVGHGTSVAGAFSQVAPDAPIISLRIFENRGTTDGRTVMRAYEWLHANATEFEICNMSWGTSEPVAVIDRVHNALVAKGIRTVSAAGNSGRESGSPATASRAFSAAACDKHGRIAPFSSYNPGRDNPDVSAIGADVRLAQASSTKMGRQLSGRWIMANGTSFSAPLLSGFVALYLSARETATLPDQIQRDFEAAARDVGGERDGAGIADYGATVEPQHHVPERTFNEALGDFYRERYGPENVESEKYLTGTVDIDGSRERVTIGRADHWVRTPEGVILAVEAANDSDTLKTEKGQADSYASAHPDAVPVVALPADHPGQPLSDYLGAHTSTVFRTYDFGLDDAKDESTTDGEDENA